MSAELSVNPTSIAFSEDGGNASLTIVTNAESWSIVDPGSGWYTLSKFSGSGPSDKVYLTVSTRTLENRSDNLVVKAGDAPQVNVKVSQARTDFLHRLSCNVQELGFDETGGVEAIVVNTDSPAWEISSDADWLAPDVSSGSNGSTSVTLTASANLTEEKRTATLRIISQSAAQFEIKVIQNGPLYPNYNTSPMEPDNSGMLSTAMELASRIDLGWNLGNSLEAIGSETAWGNPPVNADMIRLARENGFNAIRIPASWDQYMTDSETAELSVDWLNRVKEVVQLCVENNMYVLLNIHWDGGWLENNCTEDKKYENNAKQKAFWEQIATHLRDFDEHLLFAGTNEPNVDTESEMSVLNSYHQTFIDAVRSTGGRNAYRTLVIQGPSTDIEKTNQLMKSLPTDPSSDHLMVEVHYYTPWNFCGLTKDESWGKMFYYWGDGYHDASQPDRNASWGEEEDLNRYFELMKQQFVDKGIPVVLGEFGAIRRSDLSGDDLERHLASRAYFFKYVVQRSKINGILPFYWDNGATGVNGSALFDRNNNSVFDEQALNALVEGSK